VRVGFDKLDPRILPDMAVKVAFRETADAPKAVTRAVIVPKSALQNLGGQDMIFTVENGRAQRRQVTVSEAQGDDAVLSAGVEAGEKVIVEAPASLKAGAAVKEKTP
jgi:hypothetical protein